MQEVYFIYYKTLLSFSSNVVKLLLKNSNERYDSRPDKEGKTLLILAAEKGDIEIVKLLLNKIENLNVADIKQQTSLMLAAKKGNLDIVKLLLKSGAKVDEVNYQKITALMLAAEKGNLEVVRLLLMAGAKLNQGLQEEMIEREYMHRKRARRFKGARESKDDISCRNGETALMLASAQGHTEIIKLILEKEVDLNRIDNGSQNALILAAKEGHTEVVKLLLEKNIKVDVEDRGGQTALIWAAKEGYVEIVKLLLEKGANINKFDFNRRTSLILAAINAHAKIVKLLLEKGADPRYPQMLNSGENAYFVAHKYRQKEVLELFEKKNREL